MAGRTKESEKPATNDEKPKRSPAKKAAAAAASDAAPAKAPRARAKKAEPVVPAEASVSIEVATVEAPAPAPAPRREPTHAEVAQRAYELWLAHGGHAFENWLEAERQLKR